MFVKTIENTQNTHFFLLHRLKFSCFLEGPSRPRISGRGNKTDFKDWGATSISDGIFTFQNRTMTEITKGQLPPRRAAWQAGLVGHQWVARHSSCWVASKTRRARANDQVVSLNLRQSGRQKMKRTINNNNNNMLVEHDHLLTHMEEDKRHA